VPGKRASLWISALILATLGLTMASGSAAASGDAPFSATLPSRVGPLTATDSSNVQREALGSITFHTLERAVTSTRPENPEPIVGAVFTVTRINGVDLSTDAGWDLARTYMNGGITQAKEHLGQRYVSEPTGSDGVTTVSDLPIGLYLIHEDLSSATMPPDPSVVPSPDFLVTIPMADPGNAASWIYDLHIYPKRTRVTLTKSVADGNAGVANQDAPVAGQVLTYTLDALLPLDGLRSYGGRCERNGSIAVGDGLDELGFTDAGMCPTGATYVGTARGAAFEIIDDLTTGVIPGSNPQRLASDYLEFVASDWVGTVTVTLPGDSLTLTACQTDVTTGCDYTLVHTASLTTVAMTDRGLAALAAATSNATDAVVRVAIQARVRPAVTAATANGVLVIPNTAMLIPNGFAKSIGAGLPSNTVKTIYAALRIHKIDSISGASLPGAVFTLYRTQADALTGRTPLAVSPPTGADGVTRFDGLHVVDFQNDGPDNDSYWIVETTTPQGYIASSTPIQVRVNSDGTTERADATGGAPVLNPPIGSPPTSPPPTAPPPTGPTIVPPPGPPAGPQPSGAMPRTGADIVWLLGIGVSLIGAGVVIALAARRRRHDHDGPHGPSGPSGRHGPHTAGARR